jgi:hypothetical protein
MLAGLRAGIVTDKEPGRLVDIELGRDGEPRIGEVVMRVAAWNWAVQGTSGANGAILARGARPAAEAPASIWPEDTVELTGLTVREAIARVDELRLAEITQQIAAGTYFTEDKLTVVAERLWEVVQKEPPRANSA